NSSGNIGIGKNNPGTALDVNGTVTATAFSGAGTVSGGTTGRIPRFTAANALGNSSITDDGTTATANGTFNFTGGALYNTAGEGGTIQLTGANATKMFIENLNGTLRLVNSGWTASEFSVDQSGNTWMNGGLSVVGTITTIDNVTPTNGAI